jgi:hypothetical protein
VVKNQLSKKDIHMESMRGIARDCQKRAILEELQTEVLSAHDIYGRMRAREDTVAEGVEEVIRDHFEREIDNGEFPEWLIEHHIQVLTQEALKCSKITFNFDVSPELERRVDQLWGLI